MTLNHRLPASLISLLAFTFAPPAFACPWDCQAAPQSGAVDVPDLLALLGAWGGPQTPGTTCDLDGSGAIGVPDLLQLLGNWGPCPANLVLFWPMPGLDTQDWVINNYVDLDPGPGLRDYLGGNKTYNGHNGVDIDVPNFRWMDNDFPILAVTDGVVVAQDDAHFDRYTACGATPWNFVTIEHSNGWRTVYGHLKQNSVVVSVGQTITAGQVLGVVGSSGCSTAPHLHFAVLDENGNIVDPFLWRLWTNPPVYDTPLGFMDAALYNQPITDVDQIKDPPPNITDIVGGETLGVGLSMAGGEAGDQIQVRLVTPGGALFDSCTINFSQVHRHSYWICNMPVGVTLGAWTVEIRLNGIAAATYDIAVVKSPPSGFQEVRHAIPASQYQAVFDFLVGNGYRLLWVDGYDVNGSTFFNAIFDQSGSGPWNAFHGLTGGQYQTLFNDLVSQGYRLVHVDSYLSGGGIRYAGLFIQQGGPLWVAYHGVTSAQHQANFDNLVAQGYRPIVISPVEFGGTLYFTALYDQANVGSFWAQHGMTEAEYQTVFNQQTAAGRTLSYINGYTGGGVARISAIWDSINPSIWVARHGMTEAQCEMEHEMWTQQGLLIRLLSGYQDGSQANFAAFWSN